ncbi:peptide antibiotic transporter SbmA [Devosia sp.]|uniref:peptide antibiotic transporter SbmA n=1 Tax=Devosia sp. TaxID=1871048 RepID=UPI001AD41419|nr:peptide antibiotic transporter SbmA [Devosia sp.]MBN9335140.1 peptide antibiotic transporter SbmA [Devosia sp.]
MFRSFFPVPKIFFSSAALWMLAAVLIWFTVGDPLRAAISIDRFTHPVVASMEVLADPPATADGTHATPPAAGIRQTDPNAPASTESKESASQQAAAAGAAESSVGNFLNGDRIWLYQYVLMISVLFCVFWYFYQRNEWYWWSVVGSTGILLVIYFQVQVEAFVNAWSGVFFDMIQLALTQPRSVTPERFYGEVFTLLIVLMPTILVSVLLAFFTSHYVFRWRKAMNFYYMASWPSIRQTEGAAQRVQEDTMRFASIVEDLGTAFFGSLITLVVFLPMLWQLSSTVTELPFFGEVPGSLVWVALAAAILGTILLAVVGIKLPGLNFANQRVEAAYRKELVFGEDHAERADPPTVKELFANVQKNYFRLYFHYTYFNLARYAYLNLVGYVPLLTMAPTILAGVLTMGIYQQVQLAFGQVSSSFQFFARAWTTIVELQSVYMRLRLFESYIPRDQRPIKASVSGAATT